MIYCKKSCWEVNKEMNKDLFEALDLLKTERGIPVDFMLERIEKAIIKACKNNYNGNDNVKINFDKNRGIFDVYLMKTVVDEVEIPGKEISLQDAREIDANVKIEDEVPVKLNTKDFGRIAAQTARNIIRQGIRDGERGQMLKEFNSRMHEVVSALVEKIDPRTGAASLRIGKAEAVLPKSELVGAESLREGDRIKVYIADVKETEKGPKAIISRTNVELVRKLFEKEIPEISNGVIEIKAIAREAGARTKMAVYSQDPNVDAVGSCIGAKGNRITAVLNELNGEKVDIIEYDEDPVKFIIAALAPAEVCKVDVTSEGMQLSCVAVVPDTQLSLAIGNKGQNVRLAARLTGWRIDIQPQSKYEQINQTDDVNEKKDGDTVDSDEETNI